MRLWSIHPKYLDNKGIIALWRESLLAKKSLEGKTKGYKNHPQLIRFKKSKNPIKTINTYLKTILEESIKRNYNFNSSKINDDFTNKKIPIKAGQLNYELEHLKEKLKKRNLKKYEEIKNMEIIKPHPLFYIIEGGIEDWEKISQK